MSQKANAISFNLDSIAQWGRFAKFCVDTYRWGDRTFNSYDSLYVVGTGTKFNVKLKSQSWIDYYHFRLEDNVRMDLLSDISTDIGVHLSYLAVSIGYDKNVSHFFNGDQNIRQRFDFGFNCSLFSIQCFYQNNNVVNTIKGFGAGHDYHQPDIKFQGIDTSIWGIYAYYFFNNKKYSQAAAFNFGKIQRKSQGSWYLGFSYRKQIYNFDFSSLPDYLREELPPNWTDYVYRLHTHNYSLIGGYGYNWVLGPHWMLAISEAPMLGYRTGIINGRSKRGIALNNLLRFSAVYNKKHLFFGLVVGLTTTMVRERESLMVGNIANAELTVGYRFNLW